MKILEKIRSNLTEIKGAVKENPDLALITLMSTAAITIGLIERYYESKRENLVYEQQDNPAMLFEMCGEDINKCTLQPITICTDFVYAREMSYCAESEILPLYIPLEK